MFVADGACTSIRDCASIRTYTVYIAFDWKAGCVLHDFPVQFQLLNIVYVLSFQWDIPGLGNHKTARGVPITTAAVIGAGTMGTGIAMAMLNAGLPVTLVEQNDSVGSSGSDFLNTNSIYYTWTRLSIWDTKSENKTKHATCKDL